MTIEQQVIDLKAIDDGNCSTGSNSPPEGSLRAFNPRPNNISRDDQIGMHILRLLTLNPDVVKFRMERLTDMDEPTKRNLLADIYCALGIQPPK